MQSTPQLFSKALFKQNLRRFWPILAVYLLLVLIVSFGMAMNYKYQNIITTELFIRDVFGFSQLFIFVVAFFSIAIAVAVYSYMHNTVATAMYNTLPYTRKTVFISNYISGLFMLLVPLLVLILLFTGIGLNFDCLYIIGLLKWLFIFTSVTLLLYSAAVIIGMFTGSIIAHAAFFFIGNFLLYGLELLIDAFLSEFLYGYISPGLNTTNIIAKATPIVYTGTMAHNSQAQNSWAIWIIYLIAGLLLAWLALKLYEKRKMENAGDVIAIRQLNPIFKYGVTFCSSLTFGFMIISIFNLRHEFFLSIIMFLLAGMVGYFVAEMLLKKSYRVFNSYKGFLVYALLFIIVSISVYNDWYGYAARLPEIDNVEAVAFSNDGLSFNATNNLQADKSRVFFDEIPNLPNSLALTYGNPVGKEETYPGNYRYIYKDSQNLTPEEMALLWSAVPGIYTEDESLDAIYKLHTYLSDNIKEIRKTYRSRDNTNWYIQQNHNHLYYNIHIVYRLKDGSIESYNYPLLMPKQITEKLDKEIYKQLATIAGSEERRAKKVATVDLAPDNIRSIIITQHIIYYMQKYTNYTDYTVKTLTEEMEDIIIAPEHYTEFLEALKADYLSISNEEMLRLGQRTWGYIRFSIENSDLPANNKYRERSYGLELDFYNKNTLEFLKKHGYINEEIYNMIKEFTKSISEKENPPRKISLA